MFAIKISLAWLSRVVFMLGTFISFAAPANGE